LFPPVLATALIGGAHSACGADFLAMERREAACPAAAAPIECPATTECVAPAKVAPRGATPFVFVDAEGNVMEPTREQLLAINTLLLRLDGPKLALRPARPEAVATNASEPASAAAGLVAAVDKEGNVVAPALDDWPVAPAKAESVPEPMPVDPADPAKGIMIAAPLSATRATLDADGTVRLECRMNEALPVRPLFANDDSDQEVAP
jgi:hypothetical protein